MKLFSTLVVAIIFGSTAFVSCGPDGPIGATPINEDSLYIATHYEKNEYRVEMRDGVELFTVVYSPIADTVPYPIMMYRTPYSCKPYGEGNRKKLGPSRLLMKDGYHFVYQDVRGRFMSDGDYVNMRPQIAGNSDSTATIDESTDTYDSIEWLIKNVDNNNGNVGMWGISYPGFYAAVGAINAHPALKATSPQAPIADWFWDDFHHHGAFFLPHAFHFLYVFGQPNHGRTKVWPDRLDCVTPDGYDFFMDLGPLSNVNDKYYHDTIAFWNEIVAHPNYDQFWKERNLLPHLKDVKPATLVVGGWFDAEDLYGPLEIYKSIEANSSGDHFLVMGPWSHGGWARGDGSSMGNTFFGKDPAPSAFYQDLIEYPFFDYYLKGGPNHDLPEAFVFDSGKNEWHEFEQWPPTADDYCLAFTSNSGLDVQAGAAPRGMPMGMELPYFDEFTSDPNKPVPYSEDVSIRMTKKYMTDDQRFASTRPDVLVYETEVLTEDFTMVGDIIANLKVSISGTDADWIVKVIDVYPDDHEDYEHTEAKMGGYQQMVRSEVIRGRFRNSYENPEPFVSGEITDIELELQDVLHTFKKGHKIMIQVQSTWFPIVDRNPQTYVDNIFLAKEEDFVKAQHRVYIDQGGSYIKVSRIKHAVATEETAEEN